MDIHFPLSIGYGMTECGPLIGGNPPKYFKARSGGVPVMNMEVKDIFLKYYRGEELQLNWWEEVK